MAAKKKASHRSVSHHEHTDIKMNNKTISYIFLGVGITIFVLNLASLLSFMPSSYSVIAFDVSVFASIIIILFSVYHMTID